MTKFKKVFASLAVSAALAAAAVVPFAPASAQVGVYNPISQWIVLSGLFNPYIAGGTGGVGGGAAMYNPISQWIVLSGLFNPGIGGY